MRDSSHMAVLVVEDSADLATNIADYLEAKGYLVDVAMDGVSGLHLAVTGHHDLIVLDLMLPGIDGLTLCRRLRQDAGLDTPVLMLTARASLEDKVAGYGEGADDYLTKPFELRELDLRLQALMRRASSGKPVRRLVVADLTLDLDTLLVERGGERITLPAIPMKILEVLMKQAPSVVSRSNIEQAIWGDQPPDSDALRVHLHTLRAAIDRPGRPGLIHTLRGMGYQIKDPDATDAPAT